MKDGSWIFLSRPTLKALAIFEIVVNQQVLRVVIFPNAHEYMRAMVPPLDAFGDLNTSTHPLIGRHH